MKKLLLLMIFAASAAFGQITTSVTGVVKDLSNANVTSGQVSFTLNPGIDTSMSGTARFTPTEIDCLITGAGAVKALDGVSTCTVTNNTALQPSGTSYKVCIQPQFIQPGSCFVWYATGGSVDITQQVPTPPLTPAYNLVDTFSNQTINANKTFGGTVTIGVLNLGGAFTATNGGTLGGSFAGNIIWLGNHTFNSNISVAGTATLNSLNKTILADQQSGADACAKITTALGLLPSTGGIVDATGFQGNQVCAAGVTFPANKPITLKLGAAALITGSNVAFTIPASGVVSIKGLGPIASGSGTTSIVSSTASSAAISWAGSEGGIEDLEIFNTAGDGLALVGSGTNSVQHNHFKHLQISSAGTIVSGKVGLHLTANSATALVTENVFENVIINDFDISELLDTSGAQGPTDNYHMGWTYSGFAGFGTAGIKITSGDVNTWTHGFISERTTGVRLTAGSYNMFLGNRFETGATDVNDGGTGTLFVGNSFTNCSASTIAATATLIGSTGNTTCPFDQFPRGLAVGPQGLKFGRITASGTAPTSCAVTGAGASGSCSIVTTATDSFGVMRIAAAGAGPAATGTLTLNLSSALGTFAVCTFTPSNVNVTWNARVSTMQTTYSATAPALAWDNNAVALAAGSNYDVVYKCTGE
jgi:hypothetical protein